MQTLTLKRQFNFSLGVIPLAVVAVIGGLLVAALLFITKSNGSSVQSIAPSVSAAVSLGQPAKPLDPLIVEKYQSMARDIQGRKLYFFCIDKIRRNSSLLAITAKDEKGERVPLVFSLNHPNRIAAEQLKDKLIAGQQLPSLTYTAQNQDTDSLDHTWGYMNYLKFAH